MANPAYLTQQKYSVLLANNEGGSTYRWLPISSQRVTGKLGYTKDTSLAFTTLDLNEADHIIREYRKTYGEHAHLCVISLTDGRLDKIVTRFWQSERNPARAALVDTMWENFRTYEDIAKAMAEQWGAA